MKFIYILVVALLLIILGAITCDNDHGLEPGPWMEGTIFIQSIDRVEEAKTGDMVVVVAPDFPPKKWTDIIKTPPIHFERNVALDTVDYMVPLNYGTYDVVAVLWKPKDEEWSFETISNILGVYTKPNLFKPDTVTINRTDKFVSGIDIYADFGFVRSGAFIKGKITYIGEFNPDTDMMILASFPSRPSKVSDYLFALGWDLTLPTKKTPDNDPYYPHYEFNLDVSPGNHKYIALFWKGQKGDPYDFRKIADLEFPNIGPVIIIGTLKYEGIRIDKGDTLKYWVEGSDTNWINLVADFSKTYP